jgi:hypothetical protein
MPAKLGLYRGRNLAGQQGDHGIFEGLHHHARAEPAKVAAAGRRSVGRARIGRFPATDSVIGPYTGQLAEACSYPEFQAALRDLLR